MRPRRRHISDGKRAAGVEDSDSCPWAYPALQGRASAQRGRSGPEAGAAPQRSREARPAERSAAGYLMR
ncbi:hypothetical protein GTY86_24775 [Streptomyces sp. SID5770]|nr:hypothetical protein [Streptomyces sp. SID5770]